MAIAVAMAFRAYFIQPFKIPTGSMQPTLYGIHFEPKDAPDLSDRMPLKLFKVAVLGTWYREIRADVSGAIEEAGHRENERVYCIGRHEYFIPTKWNERFRLGDQVEKGQVLASGYQINGDHVFVNMLRWNFLRPKRGEIIVFETKGINRPAKGCSRQWMSSKNQHYIKRLVGLPGETISIKPPYLLINGKPLVNAPPPIARIQERSGDFAGYLLTMQRETYLGEEGDSVALKPWEYFACGDNSRSSLDSRFWGPVPQKNLVGPAMFVYWPLSQRWGKAH